VSKQNKANKTNYNQAGRLTPDDMARERKRQGRGTAEMQREQISGRTAPRDAPAPSPRRSGREE
jgi:hypothetical protein